jgi:transcriptional regulator
VRVALEEGMAAAGRSHVRRPLASGGMLIKPDFRVESLDAARAVIREHPFAVIVAGDLRMTRMPCLVDETADGELAILSHVARADPFAGALGERLLVVFCGVHGYISASWYESDTIPTWNHVTLQLRGVPECFSDALPVVRRTVDRFEAAVEHPWSLDRMGSDAREMADEVIAFRLVADDWHLEAKLSQDKPGEERARLIEGLTSPGAYANAPLATEMRTAGSSSRR